MPPAEKIVVVGAGPVGALAAIYAAQRGHAVEVYELRDDLRNPSTMPLNFTKSINLALSVRGITAISHAKRPGLLENILSETIPMRGRMIHGITPKGVLREEGQDYDVHGRSILAADRGKLNAQLLDELESLPNVRFHFRHKLIRADLMFRKAWFENRTRDAQGVVISREQVEVDFDLLLGADGAHSIARHSIADLTGIPFQQEYIDTLWCEFRVQPVKDPKGPHGRFALSPHHLHIWPGKTSMFIAIPSMDGSFTCTLFLSESEITDLDRQPDALPAFFDQRFPGVTHYIKPADLIDSFVKNPHLPLLTVKALPYHYRHTGVILGDAAHAMVPFYGQGMNAGLEDVRILFSFLDKHVTSSDKEEIRKQREKALEEYSDFRVPDAEAISDMAMQNYVEMREGVTSPVYRSRKYIEEFLSAKLPWLGWHTKYSRVSFSTERYSEVVAKSERQGQVLARSSVLLIALLFVGIAWVGWR